MQSVRRFGKMSLTVKKLFLCLTKHEILFMKMLRRIIYINSLKQYCHMPFCLKDLTKGSINIFTHFQGRNGLLVTVRASGKGWINCQLLKQVMTSDKSSDIFPSI